MDTMLYILGFVVLAPLGILAAIFVAAVLIDLVLIFTTGAELTYYIDEWCRRNDKK